MKTHQCHNPACGIMRAQATWYHKDGLVACSVPCAIALDAVLATERGHKT